MILALTRSALQSRLQKSKDAMPQVASSALQKPPVQKPFFESNNEDSQVWKRLSLPEIKYPIREFKAQSKDNRSKIVMPPLREVITEQNNSKSEEEEKKQTILQSFRV